MNSRCFAPRPLNRVARQDLSWKRTQPKPPTVSIFFGLGPSRRWWDGEVAALPPTLSADSSCPQLAADELPSHFAR